MRVSRHCGSRSHTKIQHVCRLSHVPRAGSTTKPCRHSPFRGRSQQACTPEPLQHAKRQYIYIYIPLLYACFMQCCLAWVTSHLDQRMGHASRPCRFQRPGSRMLNSSVCAAGRSRLKWSLTWARGGTQPLKCWTSGALEPQNGRGQLSPSSSELFSPAECLVCWATATESCKGCLRCWPNGASAPEWQGTVFPITSSSDAVCSDSSMKRAW